MAGNENWKTPAGFDLGRGREAPGLGLSGYALKKLCFALSRERERARVWSLCLGNFSWFWLLRGSSVPYFSFVHVIISVLFHVLFILLLLHTVAYSRFRPMLGTC